MEINSIDLQKKIDNGEKIIVDFYAKWCKPCNLMKPIFEKVSLNNKTNVQMFTMDIDNNKDFVLSMGIRSIPVIKTFNDKKNINTIVGIIDGEKINKLINNFYIN